MGRFQEIKDFRLRRLPNRATTLQEVGVLSTLVYFAFLGMKMGISGFNSMILRLGELSFA